MKKLAALLTLLGTALLAYSLTLLPYVFDLIQAYERREFPHWADSMGMPLMGTPVILVLLWLWAFGNLGLVSGKYLPNQPINTAFQWRRNWWPLIHAALWLLMAAVPALFGQYWYAMPSLAWVYFFLSIGASRHTPRKVPQ